MSVFKLHQVCRIVHLVCLPNIIQQLHDVFIKSENKGNIKDHSAKTRYCSLVEPGKGDKSLHKPLFESTSRFVTLHFLLGFSNLLTKTQSWISIVKGLTYILSLACLTSSFVFILQVYKNNFYKNNFYIRFQSFIFDNPHYTI